MEISRGITKSLQQDSQRGDKDDEGATWSHVKHEILRYSSHPSAFHTSNQFHLKIATAYTKGVVSVKKKFKRNEDLVEIHARKCFLDRWMIGIMNPNGRIFAYLNHVNLISAFPSLRDIRRDWLAA